ncbi:MAG TPA: transcription termination/antitermination protein NusA [Candidatus Hydrogenedentes bacterium]|nr:transcription termination/antitermination protein NusA [Candidatus Hydrogenedentota bacterium]
MDTNLRVILQQLEAEKSVDRETLIEAIQSAIESAARKSLTHAANVAVDVDPDSLSFKVFEIREVVEQIEDESSEITLDDAQALNPQATVGDRLKVPAEPRDFGRIAAQTAKQVIIQKLKDAERENIFDEFKKREGELITGIVKRMSHGNVIVSVGKTEAIVPLREQSPRENFKPGDRIRAYLLEVEKAPRGPQIVLSRTNPELVRALFDLEVPEIYDGTVEIRAVAREAGSRTKVAVRSNDSNVDPVGACVGMKGSRVRTVVEELCGEKIDIVRWSENPIEFCGNALNPADILNIAIDEESRTVLVVVPHDQLSLAIGKRGQNARLASRLIGWSIDIRSDAELAEEGAAAKPDGAETDADEAGKTVESPAHADGVAVADETRAEASDEADSVASAPEETSQTEELEAAEEPENGTVDDPGTAGEVP